MEQTEYISELERIIEMLFIKLKNTNELIETLINRIDILEQDEANETKSSNNIVGYYTIPEILKKFSISRQTFWEYRKLVPLKESTKLGRFNRFKKVNINQFFEDILILKEAQPQLFAIKNERKI